MKYDKRSNKEPPKDVSQVRPYRTVLMCTLWQRTALSNGGSDHDSPFDMPLALDGQGLPILRGASLAGALAASARTFMQIPESIALPAGAERGDNTAYPASLWDVGNGHLHDGARFISEPAAVDPRAINAIRHDTGSSASQALADLEVLPRQGQWRFLLEVAHPTAGRWAGQGPMAAAAAAKALSEWQQDRCWLGRRVARGLGWCTLSEARVLELPALPEFVDAWPDSALAGLDQYWRKLEELGNRSGARVRPLQQCLADADFMRAAPRASVQRVYVRWKLGLKAGAYVPPAQEGKPAVSYGLDALSVGGHGVDDLVATEIGEHHLARAGDQEWGAYCNSFDAKDFTVALCDAKNGLREPFVPGSSVAGPLRHQAARWKRAAGESVLDPSTGERYGQSALAKSGKDVGAVDAVTALFGYVTRDEKERGASLPSSLLVSDAHLKLGSSWTMALLEKVALDEFTQSPYASSKFRRTAVLEATWRFEVVHELPWKDARSDAVEQVQDLLRAGSLRRLGIGGGQFRGYGHPAISTLECQWALAGEPWSDWPPPSGAWPPAAAGGRTDVKRTPERT